MTEERRLESTSVLPTSNRLRNSLAEALEIYYPVGGTVVDDENGDRCIATDGANLQGTLFVVEIKGKAFEKDSEELSPRPDILLKPGSPIFAVKLTHVCSILFIIHYEIPYQFLTSSSHAEQ